MRRYAETACRITKGITEEEFSSNEEKQLAVLRSIEIIGEAAKGVPESVRELAPGIPWRQITRTRDKLIHNYFGVDLDVIWRVVQDDLPPLLDHLKHLDDLIKNETDEQR